MIESGSTAESCRRAEARYAYYRRCQQFMKNGQQCRCPAEKGTPICRNHRQQWEMMWRRERQRFELLVRVAGARGLKWPEQVFGDWESVQMLMSALALELFSGTMDEKVAGRLLVEVQAAVKVLRIKTHTTEARRQLRREKIAGIAVIARDRAGSEDGGIAVIARHRRHPTPTRQNRARWGPRTSRVIGKPGDCRHLLHRP